MPYWIFHFFPVTFRFGKKSFRFVSFRFVSFDFVSFRFDRFRFVSFDFVSFRSVSFRFYFISRFTGTHFIKSFQTQWNDFCLIDYTYTILINNLLPVCLVLVFVICSYITKNIAQIKYRPTNKVSRLHKPPHLIPVKSFYSKNSWNWSKPCCN